VRETPVAGVGLKRMIQVQIANEHPDFTADEARLRQAVENVLLEAELASGVVSIAIVDDSAIHRLNAQFLAHDEPTDVLSFVLEQTADAWEGEIVVSADTARRLARQLGWDPRDELLLYVVHGALHLVGYDDGDDHERARMRAAERRHLARFDLLPRYE
jgi:probable rRNA maturation factor